MAGCPSYRPKVGSPGRLARKDISGAGGLVLRVPTSLNELASKANRFWLLCKMAKRARIPVLTASQLVRLSPFHDASYGCISLCQGPLRESLTASGRHRDAGMEILQCRNGLQPASLRRALLQWFNRHWLHQSVMAASVRWRTSSGSLWQRRIGLQKHRLRIARFRVAAECRRPSPAECRLITSTWRCTRTWHHRHDISVALCSPHLRIH